MENRFNLIDEAWIPVADCGQVSLRQIFIDPHLRKLGGNAVQKIALTKLLLAIAQSSPRTWRCFPDGSRKGSENRVFPTHVGVFLSRPIAQRWRRCLPHTRGGVSMWQRDQIQKNLSSPRTWGCFCGLRFAEQL